MEKAKTAKTSTTPVRQTPPAARWLQAGLALGLAYILGSWAIDSGSLLQYAAAVVFIGLGARHAVQAAQSLRSSR
jgi:hypothetical protein